MKKPIPAVGTLAAVSWLIVGCETQHVEEPATEPMATEEAPWGDESAGENTPDGYFDHPDAGGGERVGESAESTPD